MTPISLVTGASRGLGRNTALSIARHGGDVILTYRNGATEAQAAVAEIEALGRKAVALPLDVVDIASLPAFAASAAPTGNGMVRVEQRGRTTLIWRPLRVTDDWKELLGDALCLFGNIRGRLKPCDQHTPMQHFKCQDFPSRART